MNAIDEFTAWWAEIDPIENLDVPDEVWDAAIGAACEAGLDDALDALDDAASPDAAAHTGDTVTDDDPAGAWDDEETAGDVVHDDALPYEPAGDDTDDVWGGDDAF